MSDLATVIMAAGKGTRMKSDIPKVLHPVCGEPMVFHVIRAAMEIGSSRIILVVGHEREMVKDKVLSLFPEVEFVVQEPQLGTGHAVQQAESLIGEGKFVGKVLVLSGDVPLVKSENLKKMVEAHDEFTNVCSRPLGATMLTTNAVDPSGYGRVMIGDRGEVIGIIEEKDINLDSIRKIKEVNCGIYLFESGPLFEALKQVDNNNKQNEYYLPRALEIMNESMNLDVRSYNTRSMEDVHGVNTLEQLAEVEAIMKRRLLGSTRLCNGCKLDECNSNSFMFCEKCFSDVKKDTYY